MTRSPRTIVSQPTQKALHWFFDHWPPHSWAVHPALLSSKSAPCYSIILSTISPPVLPDKIFTHSLPSSYFFLHYFLLFKMPGFTFCLCVFVIQVIQLTLQSWLSHLGLWSILNWIVYAMLSNSRYILWHGCPWTICWRLIFFSYWIFLVPLLKISSSEMYRFNFRLSTIFHLYINLFVGQYYN